MEMMGIKVKKWVILERDMGRTSARKDRESEESELSWK